MAALHPPPSLSLHCVGKEWLFEGVAPTKAQVAAATTAAMLSANIAAVITANGYSNVTGPTAASITPSTPSVVTTTENPTSTTDDDGESNLGLILGIAGGVVCLMAVGGASETLSKCLLFAMLEYL